MKILITGGHLTPALSLIDFIQKHHSKDQLIFVGREFSQDADRQKAVERYEIEKRQIPFLPVQAVRLNSAFFRQPFKSLARFGQSIREAELILRKKRPQLVISFGGYVAVPFAFAARKTGIPLITHEQTLASGFANKLIALTANAVAVTFPGSVSRIFSRKTTVTGNPLREGVFRRRHTRPSWLPQTLQAPVVLIMGGNQGSLAINSVVEQSLAALLSRWIVVHQCGQPTAEHNYLQMLERQRTRLPQKLQQRYFIKEWIDDEDLFWLYQTAFCAVSRAGANSTQELAVAGLPAVLIPLPSSRHDEQRKNAHWLAQAGGAVVLEQAHFSSETLLRALEKVQTFEATMRAGMQAIELPENAAERLYALAESTAKSS